MNESDTHPTHDTTAELHRLRSELAERDETLATQATELAQMRTRHALETQLRDAGTVDIDAAMALAERALSAKADATAADAQTAVTELQRMRPWLFRTRATNPSAGSGVQSPATDEMTKHRATRLKDAAVDASVSGSRMDLLRYLRLRRKR